MERSNSNSINKMSSQGVSQETVQILLDSDRVQIMKGGVILSRKRRGVSSLSEKMAIQMQREEDEEGATYVWMAAGKILRGSGSGAFPRGQADWRGMRTAVINKGVASSNRRVARTWITKQKTQISNTVRFS